MIITKILKKIFTQKRRNKYRVVWLNIAKCWSTFDSDANIIYYFHKNRIDMLNLNDYTNKNKVKQTITTSSGEVLPSIFIPKR